MGQLQILQRGIKKELESIYKIIKEQYEKNLFYTFYRLGKGQCQDSIDHNTMLNWIYSKPNCEIVTLYWDVINNKTDNPCGCFYEE